LKYTDQENIISDLNANQNVIDVTESHSLQASENLESRALETVSINSDNIPNQPGIGDLDNVTMDIVPSTFASIWKSQEELIGSDINSALDLIEPIVVGESTPKTVVEDLGQNLETENRETGNREYISTEEVEKELQKDFIDNQIGETNIYFDNLSKDEQILLNESSPTEMPEIDHTDRVNETTPPIVLDNIESSANDVLFSNEIVKQTIKSIKELNDDDYAYDSGEELQDLSDRLVLADIEPELQMIEKSKDITNSSEQLQLGDILTLDKTNLSVDETRTRARSKTLLPCLTDNYVAKKVKRVGVKFQGTSKIPIIKNKITVKNINFTKILDGLKIKSAQLMKEPKEVKTEKEPQDRLRALLTSKGMFFQGY
jgi:hypothetical protein